MDRPIRWELREFRSLVAMCLICGACAWASAKLSADTGEMTCIWVSNAVIIAFVLTARSEWKIPLFLAGHFVDFGLDLALGDALTTACWFAVCNLVETLIAIVPLGHFEARSDLVSKPALRRIAYFAIILGPLAGALLAAPAIDLLQGRPFLGAIRVWFLSEALGGAVSIPLIMLLRTRERRRHQNFAASAADVALMGLLLATTLGVFCQTEYPLLFLLFPPMVAVIFRFRMDGAIIGTSVVVAIGAVFTAEAHGPFSLISGATVAQRVVLLQVFGLIAFVSCFPLGLVIEEIHRLAGELKLANERLSELALRDGLTGVLNRRSFDTLLGSEWSTVCARDGEISVLYIDVDHFKLFNDAYGHQNGDDCLRSVAASLVTSVRGMPECVARYGGEEFVVILPNLGADAAGAIAGRIVTTVENLQIPHRDSPSGMVTVSVGLATARPAAGGTPAELLRLADQALYAAKRDGRNRVAADSTSNPTKQDQNPQFAFS